MDRHLVSNVRGTVNVAHLSHRAGDGPDTVCSLLLRRY